MRDIASSKNKTMRSFNLKFPHSLKILFDCGGFSISLTSYNAS